MTGLIWLLAGADPEVNSDKAMEAVAAATVASAGPAEEAGEETASRTPSQAEEEQFLSFNFRHTPWKEVIPWFADEADLSLEMSSPPPGTCNYIDNRKYTLAEAIDVLNELLQIRGYTLIRRERLLMVVNLEDGIPPNLVPTISADELDNRGKHEIVSVLFKLERLTPDQAEGELKKIVEPNGKVVVLPSAQQVMVTGAVWQLRTVRQVVESIENPGSTESGPIAVFEMKYISPLDALSMIRQLMDFPEDKNGTEDGSLRIAIDPLSGKLLASGRSDLVKRVRAILETIDTPAAGVTTSGIPAIETPQLVVYGVGSADPNTVLSVLQTIFAGSTDMNLALDPQNGSLIARAKPSQHATIRATIEELSGEAKQVEVFKLTKLDPQLAVLAINKLFSQTGENAAAAPKVDAEPNTRQLMVRGSKGQVDEIRKWLEKMGEVQTPGGIARSNDRMRMLPLTGRAQRLALEQLEQIWPTMRRNQIRVVTPSAVAPTLRGLNPAPNPSAPQLRPNRLPNAPPAVAPDEAAPTERTLRADEDRSSAAVSTRSPFQLAVQQTEVEPPLVNDVEVEEPIDEPQANVQEPAAPPTAETDEPSDEHAAEGEPADAAPPKSDSPIIISPGPGGVMIASEDTEALDALEAMLNTLAQGAAGGSTQEFTVFYLQNASATTAAQTLASILGGSTAGSDGGSLMGDLAGAAFGDMGGLMGSLMGFGGGNNGGGGGSGTVTRLTGGTLVVPDMRLNALFVQASQSNLDTIEQLLQVIDQPETPETQISPRPRIIQLYATDATEISNIVKAVYQEQTSAGSGQRQPSPQEFMQMMFQGRGGRGGRGGGNNNGGGGGGNSATDVQKMTIGVDTRNNCLIVSAPQPLYEEVEQLVRTLDQAIPTSPETTRVVTLKRANTESVQSAIAGLLGDSVQSSSNSRNNNNNNRNGGRNQNQGNQNFRQFGPGGFGGFGQGGFGGPGGFGGFGGPGGGGFGQGGRGQGGGQGGGGGRGNGGGGGNRGR